MYSTKKQIIDIIESLEELKDIDDVGYTISISKMIGRKELYIGANVNIEMKCEHSKRYINTIQECHAKIEALGFGDLTLHTGNANNKAYANIYGNVIQQ